MIKKLIYSWFEFGTDSLDLEINEDSVQNLLKEFISTHRECNISKEDCDKLAESIPEHESYRNRSKDGSWTTFLNKYLNPMGYQLNKVSNEDYYRIKPIEKED